MAVPVQDVSRENVTDAAQEAAPPRCRIRGFRPEDRPAVREICAATGLLGDDIRRLFPRPDFFVDLFTSYYTDLEPEACLVVEARRPDHRPEVVGYLLGCTNPGQYRRHQPKLLFRIACRVIRGLLQQEFDAAARSYLWWTIMSGWREMPRVPAGGAHFHFNLIREWRNHNAMLPLLTAYLDLLRRERPELKVVWGQMTTYGKRRSEAVFRRFGWKFYDQVRLTKYDLITRAWGREAPARPGEASARTREGPAGRRPGSQYARCQLPEIYLTTICRQL
jgi:hypothetical protein